ncbi:MAG TPA: Asd/ArgC dimerization domain-containing protein [Bryobacteraceae bacterium]|nr:Asd/ArgC dimerization domain-containing protein [Bryobacteraceae bacterium]
MHSHRGAQKSIVAVIGGESLLGREVSELLESSGLPVSVQLVAAGASDDTAILSRSEDEPIVIQALQMADLGSARVVILAGSHDAGRKAYELLLSATPTPAVIDLSGGLEDHPAARLRAPMAEPPGFEASKAIQEIAHPAAIALALFFTELRNAGVIARSVVEIFEPVSERGQAGIDELQKQAVSLLSFKPLPKKVFDAQVSFNLLAAYGSDAPLSLEDIELRIDRHLASLLAAGGAIPMPSLRLIQAPVFHGYSISAWVEFEDRPETGALIETLQANRMIDVRTKEHEPPTNVGVAGQGGITVGAITPDRNHPRAAWFWIVADNLRISAENALEVAREFLK